MDILSDIQTRLIAPKSQYNKFGKYYFRNCEDILEGLKPLLKEHKCSVVVEDDIVMVGNRIYVKSIVRLLKEKEVLGQSTGFARESEKQAGMQDGQLTGSTSSYARKYALNGLFAIDDSKDADTNEHQNNADNRPVEKKAPVKATDQKAIVTQVTNNIVRAYLTHDKLSVDLKIQAIKEKLNSKELLANQYLVDELIKEYGSLESLNA